MTDPSPAPVTPEQRDALARAIWERHPTISPRIGGWDDLADDGRKRAREAVDAAVAQGWAPVDHRSDQSDRAILDAVTDLARSWAAADGEAATADGLIVLTVTNRRGREMLAMIERG